MFFFPSDESTIWIRGGLIDPAISYIRTNIRRIFERRLSKNSRLQNVHAIFDSIFGNLRSFYGQGFPTASPGLPDEAGSLQLCEAWANLGKLQIQAVGDRLSALNPSIPKCRENVLGDGIARCGRLGSDSAGNIESCRILPERQG